MPTNFWEFLHLNSEGIGILIFVFMVLLFFLIVIARVLEEFRC